ncbi:MAG: hypothetical protein LBJ31_02245 [Treponema sp.]|jgi:hypothetical protein|nr:hypothetical protein [Treponema sp.]
MKKFFVFMIILLAAASAAFFLGWAQFGLPPGSFGVLRSKTHGVLGETIREGNVTWVWYKLIPRNATLSVFTLEPRTKMIESSGVLPSGAVYSSTAGLRTDFSWKLSASVSFRLAPSALPALAEQYNLLEQGDLDKQLLAVSRDIENYVRSLLWTYGENEKALLEAQKTGAIADLTKHVKEAFPSVEIENCAVNTLNLPDFVLYEEARAFYREFLAGQRSALRGDIGQAAARNVTTRFRFEELSGYGELLTKYPVLLQYLALERGFPPK